MKSKGLKKKYFFFKNYTFTPSIVAFVSNLVLISLIEKWYFQFSYGTKNMDWTAYFNADRNFKFTWSQQVKHPQTVTQESDIGT